MAPKAEVALMLPLLVSGPVEVGRMIRELEVIDGALSEAQLRAAKGGPATAELPHITKLMQQLIELNKLDLRLPEERQRLAQYLHHVRQKAPVLHISFSAEPNAGFIEKLMAWLRHEIDPLVLLTIGLEPNIGAGCIVRSTNKYFDFSLRQDFASKREMLLGKLTPQPLQIPQPLLTNPVVAAVASASVPVAPAAPAQAVPSSPAPIAVPVHTEEAVAA